MNFYDILFIFLFFALPIFWHSMMKSAGLSYLKITIPGFVISYIFLIQYIGIVFLYFSLDKYRSSDVSEKEIIFLVWILTSSTITLMLLGYRLARRFLGELSGFTSTTSKTQMLNKENRFKLLILEIASIFFLITYLYKLKIKNVAICALLGLSDVNHHVARSLMGNSFDGKHHWYNLFYKEILCFCFFCFLANKFCSSKKSKNTSLKEYILSDKFNMFFFGSFLLFVLLMTTEKAPLVNFIISCYLIFSYIKNNGNLEIKSLIILIIIIAIFSVFIYFAFIKSNHLIEALTSVLSRTFCGQIQPAYYYLKMFPEHQGWLYGASFPNPSGLFPFEHYPLTFKVMDFMVTQFEGVVGSAPTIYWGELYANWGYLGALSLPLFVGYFLYWLNIKIFSIKKTPISIAFFIFLISHYKDLASTSISGFIFDFYFFGLALCMIFLGEWHVLRSFRFKV